MKICTIFIILTDPEELQPLFNEIDKDGDQLISKEELNELLDRLGHKDLCQEKVSKIFGEIDEDKDDKINFERKCTQFF